MVTNCSKYQEILDKLYEGPCTLLAGGTDIMVRHRRDAMLTPAIDGDILLIHRCQELQYIREEKDGVHIGSMTRLEDMLHHPLIPQILKDAIYEMASVAIRNVATIGGNIGNASPAGDSLPVLYLLNTELVLASVEGERVVAIEDFIIGPGQIDLKSIELIKEIRIERHNQPHMFKKIGSRKADTISKLSFAGSYKIENNQVIDLRLAFGAVYKTIVRNRALEQKAILALNQGNADSLEVVIQEILDDYSPLILPIDDQRSSKEYRKEVTIQVLKAFCESLGGELPHYVRSEN